jgi:alpha-tubulin suppressor-like RCC1 family protein
MNNILDISCGKYHTMIKDNNNLIYSFGLNSFGQLGLNDLINRFAPTQIKNFDNINQITTGETFSLFLTFENKLYSFGENQYGALGLGKNANETKIPNRILSFTNFKIKKISSGFYHTLVLDYNGEIYSFGRNNVNLNNSNSLVNLELGI